MSSSNRRSRFRVRVSEPEPDPIMEDAEACSENGTVRETDFESMTAKGIKRLCSELMELKKASDEDFQRNIYSNCSSFIRIFEEIGYAQNNILELKNHALTQTKLIQTLIDNLYSDAVINDTTEKKADFSLPTGSETHMEDWLVTLDVFLTEQRLTEALNFFEEVTLDFQKLQNQEDQSSPIVISYTYALPVMKTKLVDQLALIAEHPRVSQPELQKALSSLFQLSENTRANSLLIKYYSSRIQNTMNDKLCSEACVYGIYIRELSRAVFSLISQAAKCFTNLNGEASPYISELNTWIREEIKMFSDVFCTYVNSIYETNGGLVLVIEAAKCAIAFCSLLQYRTTLFLPYLMELITPCMEKILHMHLDHFKKVVRIFMNADNWVVGKFLRLGILKDKSIVTEIGEKVEYFQLTSSGRKFVTLMQGIMDDISPLTILNMEASILEGITALFLEYIHALRRALPSGENTENISANASCALTFQQQLSLMVNASTIVQIFPCIACTVSKEIGSFSPSIEEALEQIKDHFCHQFVFGVMYHRYFEATTCLDDLYIPNSSQDLVPSFPFQALFLRMRQLELLSKSMFADEDWIVELLPKAIVDTLAVWISNNKDFWSKTVDNSCIGQHGCFEQAYLDMHFLMEFTQQGGYCSDELLDAAAYLIEEMEETSLKNEPDPIGHMPDGEWASNVAKLTIKQLLKNVAAKIMPTKEASCSSLDEFDEDTGKYENPTDLENSFYSSNDSTGYESDNCIDNNAGRLLDTKVVSKSEREDAVNLKLEKLTISYDIQVDNAVGFPKARPIAEEDDNKQGNVEERAKQEHATDPYGGSICILDKQEISMKENTVSAKELVDNSKEFGANESTIKGPLDFEEKRNTLQEENNILTIRSAENKAAVKEIIEAVRLKEIEGLKDHEKLAVVSQEDEPINIANKGNVSVENAENDEGNLNLLEENDYSLIHSQELVQKQEVENSISVEISSNTNGKDLVDFDTQYSEEVENKNDTSNESVTSFVTAKSNIQDELNMLGTESIGDRYDLISQNLSHLVIANTTNSAKKQKHGSSRQRIVVKKRLSVRSSKVSSKLLEGNKELAQVDGSVLQNTEEDTVLLKKFPELVIETQEQKHPTDSENEGDLTRQRSGRKRTKSNMDGNIMGKSGKGAKALRPRWH